MPVKAANAYYSCSAPWTLAVVKEQDTYLPPLCSSFPIQRKRDAFESEHHQ